MSPLPSSSATSGTEPNGQQETRAAANSISPAEDKVDLSNLFIAKHEFKAEQPRQLSFSKKALIRVLTKRDNGWWNGELLSSISGPVLAFGWLPASYVRPFAQGITTVRLARTAGALGIGIAGGKVSFNSFPHLLFL